MEMFSYFEGSISSFPVSQFPNECGAQSVGRACPGLLFTLSLLVVFPLFAVNTGGWLMFETACDVNHMFTFEVVSRISRPAVQVT